MNRIRIMLQLSGILLLVLPTAKAAVDGSFIQLHRGKTDRQTDDWRADFRHIKSLGGQMVIVQWTAEEPILYFETGISSARRADAPAPDDPILRQAPSGHSLRGMTEIYPILERIFDAAEAEDLSVILGLQHHPEYWEQIKGREKVIRDFFRVRTARNAQLQSALLDAFGTRKAWTGYYIPDEVDDLTWRAPEMRGLIHAYLQQSVTALKERDPARFVAVSAFFRGRTSPDLVARNLMDIVAGTGIDVVLIQDGIGVGDPPLAYIPLYYDAFTRLWASDEIDAKHGSLPALWCVIETFAQTSGPEEPFTAETASPDRLARQVDIARRHFDRLILFTFDDYLHPERDPAARAAFQAFRDIPLP